MEHTEFTENQLNSFPKEAIVSLYMKLQGDFRSLGDQNAELLRKADRLQESLDVLIQQKYGRKTEKNLTDGQLSFDFDHSCVLNEAEEQTAEGLPEEPAAEEVITYRRKKTVGKREADLKGIVEIDDPASELTEDRLAEEFPGGYTRLEDETYSVETAGYFAAIRTYLETCCRNGVDSMDALARLTSGNPYTLNEVLGEA